MGFYSPARLLPQRFRLVLASFLQGTNLPFADVLSEENIQQAFDEEGVDFASNEEDVYTPQLTLWAFLSQVLFKSEQRSCTAAVARVIVLFVALGKDPPSNNTGTYCRARAKLSERVLRRLVENGAAGCQQALPEEWLWHGRQVHLIDGTTVSMPDTEANQEAFPQANTQQQGLGFPIARMVVMLSLATAMVRGYEMGPYTGKETGETALLRQLLDRFAAGDVALLDRYFCGWFTIALLKQGSVDTVTRQHQLRTTNFRRGRRLGKGDHLVSWPKPQRPQWMDPATYDALPDSLCMRELQVRIEQPGFRVESFVVVTTLTDAKQYTCKDVAELYHKRWLVELDIRAIKITLGMDVLRCQSPEMVRREVATCMLAYNLIRQSMLQSAQAAGLSPRGQSFTAAMQKIAAGWIVAVTLDEDAVTLLTETHLEQVAQHRIGNRPDRVEPRAVKRRPKSHKLLTQPREQAREELLSGKT